MKSQGLIVTFGAGPGIGQLGKVGDKRPVFRSLVQ